MSTNSFKFPSPTHSTHSFCCYQLIQLNQENELILPTQNEFIQPCRTAILTDRTVILTDRTVILTDRTTILTDRTVILTDRTAILTDRTTILTDCILIRTC